MNADTAAASGDGFVADVRDQPPPETPAAVVDVDVLERNLSRWQAECDRLGIRNRPHVKTHKCVELARLQADLGAVGLTCKQSAWNRRSSRRAGHRRCGAAPSSSRR